MSELSDTELSELHEQLFSNEIDISNLSQSDVDDIQGSLNAALDEDHGSGAHWLMIAKLSQYGFRTNSTIEAQAIAERIIVKWYNSK